jgi:hypothetical protein
MPFHILADGDILCQLATAIDRAEREARDHEGSSLEGEPLPEPQKPVDATLSVSANATAATSQDAKAPPIRVSSAVALGSTASSIPVPRGGSASRIPAPSRIAKPIEPIATAPAPATPTKPASTQRSTPAKAAGKKV